MATFQVGEKNFLLNTEIVSKNVVYPQRSTTFHQQKFIRAGSGSLALTILLSVAAPSRPPNVMIGVRQAKYMKKMDAMHCTCNTSLKSDR